MTWWSPKPLRPAAKDPLFEVTESPVVVKGLNPWQRQRMEDGTPHTIPGPTSLRPADPSLFIRDDLAKGSLTEKLSREAKPQVDPNPYEVLKAFLAQGSEEREEFVNKSQAATARMQTAVSEFKKSLNKDDEDDEEKSLSGKKGATNNAGAQRAGRAAVSAAASIPKMVLSSVPKS